MYQSPFEEMLLRERIKEVIHLHGYDNIYTIMEILQDIHHKTGLDVGFMIDRNGNIFIGGQKYPHDIR